MLSAMKSGKCYVNISPPSILNLDPKIRFHSRWSILGSNLAWTVLNSSVAHMELKSPQILGLLAGEAILVWCSIPAKWRSLHSLSFCLNSPPSFLFSSSLVSSLPFFSPLLFSFSLCSSLSSWPALPRSLSPPPSFEPSLISSFLFFRPSSSSFFPLFP